MGKRSQIVGKGLTKQKGKTNAVEALHYVSGPCIYLMCITLKGDVHVVKRSAHDRKCIFDLLSWTPTSRGRPSSRHTGTLVIPSFNTLAKLRDILSGLKGTGRPFNSVIV